MSLLSTRFEMTEERPHSSKYCFDSTILGLLCQAMRTVVYGEFVRTKPAFGFRP